MPSRFSSVEDLTAEFWRIQDVEHAWGGYDPEAAERKLAELQAESVS